MFTLRATLTNQIGQRNVHRASEIANWISAAVDKRPNVTWEYLSQIAIGAEIWPSSAELKLKKVITILLSPSRSAPISLRTRALCSNSKVYQIAVVRLKQGVLFWISGQGEQIGRQRAQQPA